MSVGTLTIFAPRRLSFCAMPPSDASVLGVNAPWGAVFSFNAKIHVPDGISAGPWVSIIACHCAGMFRDVQGFSHCGLPRIQTHALTRPLHIPEHPCTPGNYYSVSQMAHPRITDTCWPPASLTRLLLGIPRTAFRSSVTMDSFPSQRLAERPRGWSSSAACSS